MKKDVKNLNSMKNDKSLRILLDSIEDYPQRLKAFKKHVRNASVSQSNKSPKTHKRFKSLLSDLKKSKDIKKESNQ